MKTILAITFVLGALQDEKKIQFPTQKETQWKYRFTPAEGKGTEDVWKIGEEKEIRIHDRKEPAKGWILEGFGRHGGESYLVPIEDGIQIVTTRHIGYAGTPALVIAAELRWGKEKSWKFRTMNGCLAETVECKQDGTEKVTVPNGTYECLKIGVGRETFWLDLGTNHGIVKRTLRHEGKEQAEDVWELTTYSPVFVPPLTPDK